MNLKQQYCTFLNGIKPNVLSAWDKSSLFAKKIISCVACSPKQQEQNKAPATGFGHYAQQTATQLDQLFAPNYHSGLVVSLQGPWGVGKTYFWNTYTSSKLNSGMRYITISLFGKNHVDDIKEELLLKTSSVHRLRNKIKTLVPGGNINGIDLSALIALMGKENFNDIVICFDDFERMSENLNMSEVLGFISELKEHHNAKILLINNNEVLLEQDSLNHKKIISQTSKRKTKYRYQITQTNNHEIFEKYSEKIIDVRLAYEPSLQEIIDILKNESVSFEFINWNLIYELFSGIKDSNKNKKFNLRVIKQLVQKLSIPELKAILQNSKYADEIKNAFVVKLFEAITKTKVNKDLEISYFEIIGLYEKFFDNIVAKHQVGELRHALEYTQEILEKNQLNEEVKKAITEAYQSYVFDLSYPKERFVEDFYQLFTSNEDVDVVSLLSPESFIFFIKDVLIALDTGNKDQYLQLYESKVVKYLENNFIEIDEAALFNVLTIEQEVDTRLKNHYKKFYQAELGSLSSKKEGVLQTIDRVRKSQGWNADDENILYLIPLNEHRIWLEKDKEYFEKVLKFLFWLNSFSGDKPFNKFFNQTKNIIKDLASQEQYKHRLSFALRQLGIEAVEKND